MIVKNLGKIVLFLFFPMFLFGNIEFTQKIVKEKVFLNETIKVILELKITNDLGIEQVNFEKYETFDFWIKEFTNKKIIKTQDETIYIYEYLLDAKNTGEFILPKQIIGITSEKIRKFKKWEKVYSNEEKINILPLYKNQAIQGSYSINANVNKTKIKANESITLNLEINGKGNIQDINPFNFTLDEQMIYKDKPIINKQFINDSYEGQFVQKFLIIANKSFTIPSIQFEYFDIKKNRLEKISTQAIFIEVEELSTTQGDDPSLKYIFAFGGFVLGFWFIYLLNFGKNLYIKANHPFVKKIKKSKNDKELYELLIKHPNNYNFKKEIKLLEENIYTNQKHEINKREIIRRIIS